jgi:ribosomal protein L30E
MYSFGKKHRKENLEYYNKLTPVPSYVHQIEIGSDRIGGAHIYMVFIIMDYYAECEISI